MRKNVSQKPARTPDASRRSAAIVRNTPTIENEKQKRYLDAIMSDDLVFGIGPAGVGKTYLSLYAAARLYAEKKISRIFIIRHALEAGERLGFLPGEIKDKTDPYFTEVVRILKLFLEPGRVDIAVKKGDIALQTFAFLRSGTLDHAIVLIEEAQNCTIPQMKLALTRWGVGTRYVVSGDDFDQCDLPKHIPSGFTDAYKRFGKLSWVRAVHFTTDDIVRSGRCKDVVKQYHKPLEECM